MHTDEAKQLQENVIANVIDIKVPGESASKVCDKMNLEYKNIKLLTVTPIKGEDGMFDVHIEIYNPDVWMSPNKPGYWPTRRKGKRSNTPSV